MESKPSDSNEDTNLSIRESPLDRGYEVLTNKTVTTREIVKYIKLPLNTNEVFQTHENDKVSSLSQKGTEKYCRLCGVQCTHSTKEQPHPTPKGNKQSQLDNGMGFMPNKNEYKSTKHLISVELSSNELNSENEKVLKQSLVTPTTENNKKNYESVNKRKLCATQTGFRSASSLICKIINCEGEPVKVNDEVISNKLILSCYPSKFYRSELAQYEKSSILINKSLDNHKEFIDNKKVDEKTSFILPHSKTYTNKTRSSNEKQRSPQESGSGFSLHTARVINYEQKPITVNDQVSNDKESICYERTSHKDDEHFKQTSTIDQQIYLKDVFASQQEVNEHPTSYKTTNVENYDEAGEKSKKVGIKFAKGTSGFREKCMPKRELEIGEWYRQRKCQESIRDFNMFSCALFTINIILLLVGVAVLINILNHMLFNNYINDVLQQQSFIPWIWTAFIISLFIIFTAIFGVLTSIMRTKRMLFLYFIMAGLLAIVVILFLVIFWIKYRDLKTITYISMVDTKNMYRCNRLMHNAWDSLQEKFQCCGIESSEDWKYIPASCCSADSKSEKLGCISNYIHKGQAFQRGCERELEDYFATKFLLQTLLLVLAVIILLVGTVAAWRLLKLHQCFLACKHKFTVTS